jgi:hypothetical protein
LDDLGESLGGDQVIQDRLHLFQGEIEAGSSVGVTEGAVHVAGAVHLDDAHAGVLLVIGAQPAIVRAAVHNLRRVLQRDGARLVESGLAGIGFRVAIDERFEAAVLRAAFAHIYLAVPQQDLGVDDPAADGANAARQLVEDVIGVNLFCGADRGDPGLEVGRGQGRMSARTIAEGVASVVSQDIGCW